MSLDDNLSLELASYRTELISGVEYDIELSFQEGSKSYHGTAKISFNLKKDAQIPLDFISKRLIKLSVNDRDVEIPDFQKCGITLSQNLLVRGHNDVMIEYVNDYDTNGTGLHKFVEEQSGSEYIFSDLEPFECHKIFPCFDQPDLKSIIRLTVHGPKSWIIMSNSLIESHRAELDRQYVKFQPTKPLSTYVFCLVCGNFAVRTNSDSPLPMNIVYRKSMEPFIPFDRIFSWTTEAIKHFEAYLGIPYPYSKYDQAFVPEFNGGAMENAGLVTFTERYLSRGKPTASEIFELAGTVVHELAHMWFGNLVTMKWWDGLWLNEAFATYFGYSILGRIESFEDWGLYFTQEVKNRAFELDQSSTTHPIVTHCEDTNSAFASFDAITYEKAAAIVHQLIFQLSEDAFRAGINQYLTQHSYGVAELDDFLNSMQAHTALDLQQWSEQWLKSENLNTIEPIWEEDEGHIKKFFIRQTAPDSAPILRNHRTRIALYSKPSDRKSPILPSRLIDAHYDGKLTEIRELENEPSPFFVYCNHSDFDYVKTILDPKSFRDLKSIYPYITEDLTRQLIANSLWNMVLDAKISPLDYMSLVSEIESTENNQVVSVFLINTIRQTALRFVPKKYRESVLNNLFSIAWTRIGDTHVSYERKCAWYSILINSMSCDSHCERLILALKKGRIESFELDLDQKWKIIKLLAYRRHASASLLLDDMRELDAGDLGSKYSLEASSALRFDKDRLFEEILKPQTISSDLSRAKMLSLFHPYQEDECEDLVPTYFQHLKHIFIKKDRIFSRDFSNLLYPFPYKQKAKDLTLKLLKEEDDLPGLMVRSLKENLEEVMRYLKIEETFFNAMEEIHVKTLASREGGQLSSQ